MMSDFSCFRLVSGYMDSVVDWENKGTDAYKGYNKFLDFLNELVIDAARLSKNKDAYEKMSLDWRPYATTHCNFCRTSFTHIQKTETFNEDRQKILELVGLGNKAEPVVQHHIHTGDKIQNITRRLFKDIPTIVKEKLISLYKFEFELFGYNKTMY